MIGCTCTTCWNAAIALRASSFLAKSRSSNPRHCRTRRRGDRRGGQAGLGRNASSSAGTGLDAICGMRDVLIHDYIGVDLDEVWNVASARIPELQAALEQFLGDESAGPPPVPMTSP